MKIIIIHELCKSLFSANFAIERSGLKNYNIKLHFKIIKKMFLNVIFKLIFLIFLKFPFINSFPVSDIPGVFSEMTSSESSLGLTPPEIIKFMKRFGYLDSHSSSNFPDSEAIYHESAIADAVKNIQKYGNINQTGVLDNATLKLMTSPRCGVPDITEENAKRHKRYVIGAKRWQKRNIKYFIANWSPKVGQEQVITDMKKAFDIWSSYSNLRFKRVFDTSADIIIAFGNRFHGDNYPFDGPGNILAHAFYPYEMQSYGGDIHFDNDENWKENSTNLSDGVDFFSVALHEIGHSLGLAHSHVYSSIMFPYYKGPAQNTLDYDDIIAMYQLYITASFEEDYWTTDKFEENEIETTTPVLKTTKFTTYRTTTPFQPTFEGDYETVDEHLERHGKITTTTSNSNFGISTYPTPNDIPNICTGNFNAVAVFRGSVFIFKGEYIWRLTDNYRIMQGFPIKVRDMFSFLPETIRSIDAAYERHSDNSIVLFTDNQYWIYDGYKLIENSPRSITDFGIDRNVTKINAAMYWPKNQKIYLYGPNQFWRYDETHEKLDEDYPKNMNRWIGIPDNIDAAATMPNGKTYFFKDNLYWLYNNMLIRPESGYPRRASNAWLGCPLMQRRPLRNRNYYYYY